MENGITKGEWYASYTYSDMPYSTVLSKVDETGNDQFIAHMNLRAGTNEDEMHYNSMLIAAAPDLLKVAKAVKRLEKIIMFSNPKNESEYDEATALNSLIKLAEKAIKKATINKQQ